MTATHHYMTDLKEDKKCVLKVLLYFDIFSYPLTEEEIIRFSPACLNFQIKKILLQLVEQRLIYQFDKFYSVQSDFSLVKRRLDGNDLAARRMKSAHRFSKLVASFPFVKAVMLSGSISKGFMDDKSDIDFFIITQLERLWIVRAALAVFRRIFLLNSHRNLCTNYFIDTNNLSIPDRNYFTAIELCTLVPMYGSETIKDFQDANAWVKEFLPGCGKRTDKINDSLFVVKRIFEKALPNRFLVWLNDWLMNSTFKYWKRKYAGQLSDADFEVAFRTRSGVSKSHPQFFQRKVLDRLSQKMITFEQQHGIALL